MRRNKSEQGLTLLEMLLTIVVLTMMVYVGVNAFKRYTRDAVVNESAKQIQNLLRNAIQFYGTYGKWPASAAEITGKTGGTGVTTDICSPWPGTVTDVNCNRNAPYVMPSNISTANYFQLTVNVPTTIGPLLASRIPHAVYNNGIVTAYTFVPLQPSSTSDRGYLWGAGVGRGNNAPAQKRRLDLYMPACTLGYKGYFMPFPLNVGTDHTEKIEFLGQDFTWGIRLRSRILNADRSLLIDLHTVDVRHNRLPSTPDEAKGTEGTDDNKNHYAMDFFGYLTFCMPTNLWSGVGQ